MTSWVVAAPGKLEVKSVGALEHRHDGMAVASRGYAASPVTGAADTPMRPGCCRCRHRIGAPCCANLRRTGEAHVVGRWVRVAPGWTEREPFPAWSDLPEEARRMSHQSTRNGKGSPHRWPRGLGVWWSPSIARYVGARKGGARLRKTTQLTMSVVVLTALFGLLCSTATPAAASASRCVFVDKAGGVPDSCVFVLGAHTWVDYVRGGVELGP